MYEFVSYLYAYFGVHIFIHTLTAVLESLRPIQNFLLLHI